MLIHQGIAVILFPVCRVCRGDAGRLSRGVLRDADDAASDAQLLENIKTIWVETASRC